MEAAALQAKKAVRLPVNTDGAYINFSGAETKAMRMADECNADELALGVLVSAAQAIVKAINSALMDSGLEKVLIAGGVASNTIMRRIFRENINGMVYFADSEYSTDNAAGIAVLTKRFTEMGYGTENRYSFTD